MKARGSRLTVVIFMLTATAIGSAEPVICPLFGDDAVFQRDVALPVWGDAVPGDSLSIKLAGQERIASCDENGRWQAVFQPIRDPGPHVLRVTGGKSGEAVSTGLLAGDIWLIAGQSNMEQPVAGAIDHEDILADADDYPRIRYLRVRRRIAWTPKSRVEVERGWEISSAKTARRFTGAGYFFARQLTERLENPPPIGLVHVSWGNTRIEGWIPRHVIEANAAFKPLLDAYVEQLEPYPDYQARFDAYFEAYEDKKRTMLRAHNVAKKKRRRMAAAGEQPLPEIPPKPEKTIFDRAFAVVGLWNGMIAPLQPLAFRGVLWWQGESNANSNWALYRGLFPELIRAWRAYFGRTFPFLFVQLSFVGDPVARPPSESVWASLREAQYRTWQSVPDTAMVVSRDIGEKSMHPRGRSIVGQRLALAAEAEVYGRDTDWCGPVYRSHRVQGDAVRISFDHAKTLTTKSGAVSGFALEGADGEWHWADEAEIEGAAVTIRSAAVSEPLAVRFGWAKRMEADLYDENGLPAVPFRTDTDASPTPRSGLGK